MPTVPRYEGDRVRTRPVSGVKRGPIPGPDVFGAAAWGAASRAGLMVAQEVTRIEAEEQQRADQQATITAARQFNQLENIYAHSEEKGILHKVGREPYELRGKYVEEWDQQAGMILDAATNDRQRLALEKMRDDRRSSFVDRVESHATQQLRVWETRETDETLASTTATAVAAASTPDILGPDGLPIYLTVVQDQMAMAETIIRGTAPRLLGAAPDSQQANAAVAKVRSATHVGVIEMLLAKEQDLQAEEYYAEVKEEILGTARAKLETTLTEGSRDVKAFRAADQVWAKSVPPGFDDQDVVPMLEMKKALRERFGNDTKAYTRAVTYLEDLNATRNGEVRERDASRASALWGPIAKGATLDQVRTSNAWRDASGTEQAKVVEHFTQERQRAESQAWARTSHAFTIENQNYTRAQRAEEALERKNAAQYFAESNPVILAAKKRGEVEALLPVLGRQYTNALLTKWDSLQVDPSALQKADIDRDMFNQVASAAGLPAYQTPGEMSEQERAQLGKLWVTVEQEIIAAQAGPGGTQKALTPDQKRTIMTDIVDRKVMTDVNFWPDRQVLAATVQQNEFGNQYVPIADIPEPAMRKMLDFVKAQPRRAGTQQLRPPTDAELQAAMADQLQRAYATALMGGTDAQWQAILQSKDALTRRPPPTPSTPTSRPTQARPSPSSAQVPPATSRRLVPERAAPGRRTLDGRD